MIASPFSADDEPQPQGMEPGMVWGAGRVVLATACYGLSVNLIRNKLGHVPAAAVAALSLGLMSLPALAVALAGPGLSVAAAHPEGPRGLIAVTVLAVVGTGLALIAFNRIIQKTNALFASTVTERQQSLIRGGADKESESIVKLLEEGTSVHSMDERGQTCLHYCAKVPPHASNLDR